MIRHTKRQRTGADVVPQKNPNRFDGLPDDLVITILSKLSSSASCPSDFISVLITCKKLNQLSLHPFVVSKAGPKVFAIKAKNWCENAHRFLRHCSQVGSPEACYALGMIYFYCLHDQRTGSSLIAKAANHYHGQALYSLAIIHFNGSGGTIKDKNLRSAITLCARAADLGHNDALLELAHRLQGGYEMPKHIPDGHPFLFQANRHELAMSLPSLINQEKTSNHDLSHMALLSQYQQYKCVRGFRPRQDAGARVKPGCPVLSEYGCDVPQLEVHPVNQFLRDWFKSGKGGVLAHGLSFCSYIGCGRPEFREREFRRCAVCGKVRYCSLRCQALDLEMRCRFEDAPMEENVGYI